MYLNLIQNITSSVDVDVGYKSWLRISRTVPIQVAEPAWALDLKLVQLNLNTEFSYWSAKLIDGNQIDINSKEYS